MSRKKNLILNQFPEKIVAWNEYKIIENKSATGKVGIQI